MTARVLAGIVTFNSADTIEVCIESLLAQQDVELRVIVVDNASTDDTRQRLARFAIDVRVSGTNLGYCEAYNRILQDASEEWILVLNPDVILLPGFVSILVQAAERRCEVGSASGKLLRWDQDRAVIDSAGIIGRPQQRHLDRGAGTEDRGQFDEPCYVFGASGAAALHRRAMLEDIRLDGEYFANDFFAYRDDVDLAWRAQIQGWKCVYVPAAVARHRRRVVPERRRALPPELNFHSVKNRWLLRWRNLHWKIYLRYFLPITFRDLQVLGYVVLRERTSLPALRLAWGLRARHKACGRQIERLRRVGLSYLSQWFRKETLPLDK
ncbi:MAG: glycosyltransferase family 2 protein [Acidobacteriota bacterium]